MVLTHSTAHSSHSRQRRGSKLGLVLLGVLVCLGIWVTRPASFAFAARGLQQTAIAAGAIAAILIGLLLRAFLRVERSEASLAARNTELARAVEALRDSECRFRDWAEISCEWFWEQNAELRYTWFSDTVSRPGLRFDLIGLTRWEMVTEGVSEEQWAAHKAQLAARQPFRDFRYIRTGEDGEIHHISVSGKPIFDANGQFCGYRGAGREITAEVCAAEALRRAMIEAEAARTEAERARQIAEEATHHLLEAQRIAGLGHWVTDEAAGTVTWSPQMFEITGLPPQPVTPLDLSRISPLDPADRAVFFAAREEAMASGETRMVEVRWVRADGDIRWVHIEMKPDYDATGRPAHLFGTTQDITERKRTEDDLKATRQRLIDAIESMSDGFALFDRGDRYVMTNSNYRQLYADRTDLFEPGTTYEHMLRSSIERGRDLDGENPECWVQKMLEWHLACAAPLERRLPDGRWIRAVERRTSDGGIVAIRTDITERKQAEEALRVAQDQLFDAIESISEGFVLFDRDDRYVLTNSNYRRLYPGIADLCAPGNTFEAVMRANIERNLHEFGPGGAEDWMRQILEWHRACDAPMEQQLTDGRWIRAIERRTRDGGIVGIRTDITATKTAEAALVCQVRDLEAAQARLERLSGDLAEMAGDLSTARDAAEEKAAELAQSEGRFRDFALTSSHWLWETDAQHRFAYVSEGVKTFGWSIESLIGRTRLEIAGDTGSDPAKWRDYQALVGRHEPFRDFIYTWKNTNGEEGVASVSGDPLFDTERRFLGYRGTGRDMTRQVRAENALREAKQAAETASLAKSQFLANMSHELRTPLNAIIGFSEMIKLGIKGPVPPTYQEYAGLIHQSGEHLHQVINDILDLAKVDAGKFELREEPDVDPCFIAEACVDLVRERAITGGIGLSIEVWEPPPLLVADPTRLKQILINLLSNAVKFTPPGGSVVVAISRSLCGGAVIEVRDSGAGMTTSEIGIAFEPFGQVDAGLDRKHEGTGLGLPLARRLAELHGGTLSIDSEKGRGTTVKLVLPAATEPGSPLTAAAVGTS
ncbi:MAG: PAS-domain containing protein [Alphaproteobacteria bacterium]|nr:PAS-domain containing protein [Alphaproteobacteria bacterium]